MDATQEFLRKAEQQHLQQIKRWREHVEKLEAENKDHKRHIKLLQASDDSSTEVIGGMDAEIENLKAELTTLRAILENPEKWMKWCDIKAFEKCEKLEAENNDLKAAAERNKVSFHLKPSKPTEPTTSPARKE